ncbi:MAG TPA: hypothetical protein VER58_11965 [Thermoanaerobaculia bacterium]|nr:hypothetical protein [Thermoanaerobaculia bacterium]
MRRIASLAICVLCAATLFAEDSPLVRAAKIGAAKRKQVAGKHQVVIDNDAVKSTSGHITMGPPVLDLPPLPKAQPATTSKVVKPTLSPAEREQLVKKIATLKAERTKLNDQGDQPYSEEGNEDYLTKRQAEIQKQLADAERQLAANPPQ